MSCLERVFYFHQEARQGTFPNATTLVIHFETIIEAVVKKRLVALEYRPIGGQLRERTVAPLQIINYQGRWYLYGFCNLRQENQHGAMARVISPPELVLQARRETHAMAGLYPPEKNIKLDPPEITGTSRQI